MNVRFGSLFFRPASVVLMAMAVLSWGGCGGIADTDRKVVAEFNGETLNRSDLKKIIREMSDEVKPLIQNRGDLVVTLNSYINDEILGEVAKALRQEKKISVDREQARAAYFTKNPDYVNLDKVVDPSALDISLSELAALQAEMEFGIDDELKILYRDAAFEYRMEEYINLNDVQIDDAEFSVAYNRQLDSLKTLEYVDFVAIRIPNQQGAMQEAVKARGRMQDGESFDVVLQSYLDRNGQFGMRAAFENDPMSPRFQQFWYSVTGCSKGDILGPVFLPAYDQFRPGPDGQSMRQQQPEAWLVLQVIEHRAPRQKTLEDAKSELAMPIIAGRVIEMIRAEHGVVIYPEELWRPEGYGDQYKGSMIRTK